jgi:hypothetical protein
MGAPFNFPALGSTSKFDDGNYVIIDDKTTGKPVKIKTTDFFTAASKAGLINPVTPTTPSQVVEFDQLTPTTPGVTFSPDTPALSNTLYVSTIDASTWLYEGGTYITKTYTTTDNTPFYILGTTVDAGGNKTAPIQHLGPIRATKFTGDGLNITGINAANLAIGTIATNRMGSGTANSTTFLRGDNTWAAASLTYFTEAQNSSAPNATVKVDSLTAVASTTDADFSIVPKGMGSFLLAIPDNTTAGGNKRGLYSVDLQTAPRATADQVCSGNYASLLGGYRSKVNADHAIAGGNQNTASGLYSLALGGASNVSNGSYSVTFGYSNMASQTGSVAIGFQNTASGQYSFCGGYTNTANNTFSFALGNNNSVTAISSFGLGSNNTVSGGNGAGGLGYYNVTSGGTAFGIGLGNYADGDYSVCLGARGKAFGVQGRLCHMADYITTQGEFQTSEFILGKRTTDATPTILSVNFGVASAINQVVLQNNNVFRFKGQIVGKQSGSTNVGVWDIDGVIVRGANAGTTALVGIPTISAITNLSGWGTPILSADTTIGCLKIEVIGLTATNIHWMCKVETTEAIY